MYPNVRKTSMWNCIFFITFFTLVVTLALNIVVGILIDGVQEATERESAREKALVAQLKRATADDESAGAPAGSGSRAQRGSSNPSPLTALGRKWWARDLLDRGGHARVYELSSAELVALVGATDRIELQLGEITRGGGGGGGGAGSSGSDSIV